MCNCLIIESLLLPDDLRIQVFEACHRWNEASYLCVNELLGGNAEMINELKEYYRSITQRDFDFVKMMNIE